MGSYLVNLLVDVEILVLPDRDGINCDKVSDTSDLGSQYLSKVLVS